MKVWRLWSDEMYSGLTPLDKKNEEMYKIATGFLQPLGSPKLNNGIPLTNWPLIKVERITEDGEEPMGDLAINYSNRSVSERAKQALEARFGDYIQFLPIYLEELDEYYYVMNVLFHGDFLDYNITELKKNKYGHLEVTRDAIYAFKDEVAQHPCFCTYEGPRLDTTFTYYTDLFKDFVESMGFTGFNFEEVYDSEKEYPILVRNIAMEEYEENYATHPIVSEDSAILLKNMQADGLDIPPYPFVAQQIVPANDPEVQSARDLLAQYDIALTSSINGVFLPIAPDENAPFESIRSSTLTPCSDSYHYEIVTRMEDVRTILDAYPKQTLSKEYVATIETELIEIGVALMSGNISIEGDE